MDTEEEIATEQEEEEGIESLALDCQSVDDLDPGNVIIEAQLDTEWEVLEVTDERRVSLALLSDECPLTNEVGGYEDSWNDTEIGIGLEQGELIVLSEQYQQD